MSVSFLGRDFTSHLGAVVLAAGKSSRMKRPKLLLPWGKTSVLGHLAAQWKQLGAGQTGVVFAADDVALQTELDRISFPTCHRIPIREPRQDMFSSIQAAARWSGWQDTITHFAIILGDQPHLSIRTLQNVLAFAAAHSGQISQPSHRHHPRHPVILPRVVFQRVASAQERTFKQFLDAQSDAVELCELDDAALDLDLDTPADYERALDVFRPGDTHR